MDFLENLEQLAGQANPAAPVDYRQDGLLYCGSCGTPKECRLNIGGRVRIVRCQCACANRRYEAERQKEENLRIQSLRLSGIADKALRGCCFDLAEETPLLRKCRSYAENWEQAKRENIGLLLWGDAGGGKTFGAACIVNALISRGIPALITSFPKILAAPWEERGEFIKQVGRFQLLVLDDLGAEQGGDYALRTVYSIIDERYKSGLPLIVTTNLTVDQLRRPESMDLRRVYDRVLELCTPVHGERQGFRPGRATEKLETARRILGA